MSAGKLVVEVEAVKVSKKTRQRRRSVKALDADARQRVFERDGLACVRCGKKDTLQWAHIVSRRHKHLRWDEDNAVTFCAGCHMHWHHAPLEAVTWFREKYPERAEKLLKLRHQVVKVNVKELAAQLGER